GLVPGRGDHATPILAEFGAEYAIGMPAQDRNGPTRLGVPNSRRLVGGGRDRAPSVRAERNADYRSCVAREDRTLAKILMCAEQGQLGLRRIRSFTSVARIRQRLQTEQHRGARIVDPRALVSQVRQ